ncbi:Protein translocase subunit SecF [Candidatus Bealeia paramacronuclearis]|uniref:Protein-export membrane protein SecF n=1 Tax=Candidatus Bealeia paramacronuclearis TaxID=1921001 RepID=A0ABZ2C4S1_9PROT|nr:Protein translocase subunit SecF [Candidatus Bealeia paramacronuclearis]
MAINFIPHGTKIDFMGMRKWAFSLTILMVAISIATFLFKGLNYGIDFKGGLVMEVRSPGAPFDLGQLRSELHGIVSGEIAFQEFGSAQDILIRIERQPGGDEAQIQALDKVKAALGSAVEYRKVETVGPKVSQDLLHNGLLAIFWSLLAIMVYIWFRFEWQYGLCGVISLLHDCFSILGFYAIFNYEFNETSIIAILTTATYSINDTVVVYDRIRENLRKYKKMPFKDIINLSLNDTLSRTILTSSTVLMSLLALYFFGGPVIASFSLPIFIGITVGTFSSIFISAPLLLYFKIRPQAQDAIEKA